MSAEREESPVGKRSQSWLCDSNLIEAGPQSRVAGPAVSLGAGGDRWHSGYPNHSDTTQGAAVADCRGEQRAAWLCLSH